MIAISKHRHLLESHIRLGLPPHDVVTRSYEKTVVMDWATTASLSPPTSIVCADRSEAVAAADHIGFPVMVKPSRSQLLDQRLNRLRHQPSRIASEANVLKRMLDVLDVPIIIQRYVQDASVLSVSGVIAEGRVLAMATSRYHRTWPPSAGAASFSETMATPTTLATSVQTFLEGVGWQGIFEIELLASKGGRFSLIDFNPRVYGSMALAIEAGVNLPVIWCDWLLGRDLRPAIASPHIRYRWESGEAHSLLWRIRRGEFGEAASIARPRSRVVHALFRFRDPAPLLAGALFALSRGINERGERRAS